MEQKIKNLKIENSKYFNETIVIIGENPGITHGELAEKLNTICSNLSGYIKRISEYDPPLIEKEICGKYRSYTLTPEGNNFYKRLTKTEYNEGTNITYKKDIMTYILETQESNPSPYVQLLRSINIEKIDKVFTLPEFTILCKALGIIPEEEIKEQDLDQTLVCWEKMQKLIENDIESKKKKLKEHK